VVAVGRLHAQKNYDHLIDALALARVERPDLGLLILGGGSCRARARLEGRARALGLGAALRFEGEVANPHPLMARAAAYALTSRWEGASNSLLEALACGVPVVASQTAGAASEVLSGGRFGALADPDDPCDLARAILKQLDPSTSALPGERAVDFRIDATLARLCAVIAGARRVHNEVQTQPEWQRHPAPLSQPIPERTKEF
jgi:glycosyltransferase involved in cell wall biosynthesis